ncbi:CsbD family protein [Kocuria dechangensis]|uniref:CsbD family protein n=1 Tax=Kocuria dechangensis TaxID=1176249 RepID=UPI00166A6A35|nr:CsbD family protein [Kocuria dechangensis]
MGLADKINNAADTAAGAAKKKVGEATNNRDLQAEGQAQESTGHLKQAGEKLKDAAKDVTEGLK